MSIRSTMAYLRYRWEHAYTFAVSDGKYTALARSGDRDLLTADDPDELLIKVRRHYPGRHER